MLDLAHAPNADSPSSYSVHREFAIGALLTGVGAVAVGTGAAISPFLTIALMVAAAVFIACYLHPPVGAVLIIVSSLLLVGIDRGSLLPVLRPSEAVIALAGSGIVLRVLFESLQSRRERIYDFAPTNAVDWALASLVVTGSILPLGWMLVRGTEITADDLTYALQLWKYFLIYMCIRWSVRTQREVRQVLVAFLAAASLVAIVAILQSLSLFGVPGLLSTYFAPFQDSGALENSRGTSTIASSLAVADVMVFGLALVGAYLAKGVGRIAVLVPVALLLLLGALAAGQFSGVIALGVALIAFAFITRRGLATFAVAAPAMLFGALLLSPVIAKRLEGFQSVAGYPQSWQGRLDNLQTFFLPDLFDGSNSLTGVRTSARVAAPESWREFVFIESGYVWLLWTGGVLMLIAFGVFTAIALKRVVGIARARQDDIGVAAVASSVALIVLIALMVLDPHLTLRGAAESHLTLLALALVGVSRPKTDARAGPLSKLSVTPGDTTGSSPR